MSYLEFCSNCGKTNLYGKIDGNIRYHCSYCNTIHYENPKPTATLLCPKDNTILLVKRAFNPGKGSRWCHQDDCSFQNKTVAGKPVYHKRGQFGPATRQQSRSCIRGF